MATTVKEAPKPTAESIVPNLDFGVIDAKRAQTFQCTRCGGTVFTFSDGGKVERDAAGNLRGVTTRHVATCDGCRFVYQLDGVA